MYVACQNGGAAPARVVTLGAPRREGARGKRRARAGETHVRATTRAAAKAAGRPSPRESSKFVICSLPLFSSLPSSLGSLSLFFTTLAHVTMAAVESDADWRKILEQRGVAPPSAGPHRCESGTEADEMGNFVCGIFVLLFAVGVGGSAANGRGEGERPTEADSEGRVTDNSREKERNERHSTLKENLRLGHDHTHKQTYNTHTHTHSVHTSTQHSRALPAPAAPALPSALSLPDPPLNPTAPSHRLHSRGQRQQPEPGLRYAGHGGRRRSARGALFPRAVGPELRCLPHRAGVCRGVLHRGLRQGETQRVQSKARPERVPLAPEHPHTHGHNQSAPPPPPASLPPFFLSSTRGGCCSACRR